MTAFLPPLAVSFLLTLAISGLIGIGLREYYEAEGKFDTFGTVRTFVFIGLLGYMLYQLPEMGNYAFLLGLAVITPFLLVYYHQRVRQKKSPGLIGVMIALTTYATGPVAIHRPRWFLILFAVSILFVLHSKGKIRALTDRLDTGEVVTACKFLAIAGVILPLIPTQLPTQGLTAKILAVIPVTPHQIWMGVVITTAISYFGYVLQTYLYPRKGILLTGLLGGLYSSTATVLVVAKRSIHHPGQDREATAAILLAVSMMYIRLLALVAVFRFSSALHVAPTLLILALLAAGYAFWVRRSSTLPHVVGAPSADSEDQPKEDTSEGDAQLDVPEPPEPALRKNPLELNSALFFALMFVAISTVTKYSLLHFKDLGLRLLSFVVGCSDITPFVVSVLQGNLGIGETQILQAIVISSASNNLVKAFYTYLFGTRRTALLVGVALVGLAVLSFLFAAILG